MNRQFPQVASQPYKWPFDGPWSPADTACLAVGILYSVDPDVAQPESVGRARQTATRFLASAVRMGLRTAFTVHPLYERETGAIRLQAAELSGRSASIIEPGPEDEVIEASGLSAFYSTELHGLLERWEVRNLIVFGVPTDGAVHATMRDANDRGFECLLLEDASAAYLPEHHEAIVRVTRFGNGLFGTTATTGAVLDSMGAPSSQ
jgi:nicotinamidase-related amidase